MDMEVKELSAVTKANTRTWSLRQFVCQLFEAAFFGGRKSSSTEYFPLSPIACSLIAAMFLVSASCATVTPEKSAEREYKRENALVLAREDFVRRSESCTRRGGAMQITKYSSSRIKKYTAHEYKSARCVSY